MVLLRALSTHVERRRFEGLIICDTAQQKHRDLRHVSFQHYVIFYKFQFLSIKKFYQTS